MSPASVRLRRVRVFALACSTALVLALPSPISAGPIDIDGLPLLVDPIETINEPLAEPARSLEPAPLAPEWDGVVAPSVQANAAVIIDETSGARLYGQDEHLRLPPASITKIMTALVALDRGNLDDQITVQIDGPQFARQTDSSVMGLLPGDQLTLRDLLYGLMLPSGNDAAIEIARYIAGSEAAFVDLMNEKVRELGLQNTRFANPHGLNDPQHYTTAWDITMIGRAAMRDPRFAEIARAPEWTVQGSRTYTMQNLNGLLWYAPGADGIKTGWHEEAGMTIVGSVTRNGRRLYVTLLNDNRQLPDAGALVDWAFAHFNWK